MDSTGQKLVFILYETRSTRAAKQFIRKVLGRSSVTASKVINVDKNTTDIGAVRELKQEELLRMHCWRRPIQLMNDPVDERYCRTGSLIHKMPNSARVGLRIIPNCFADDSGIRDDAHGTEGAE